MAKVQITSMNERSISSERLREMLGVLFLALAIFFLLCLFSYDPADPSFAHPVLGKTRINNLCGSVGSYGADALIRFMGISAFWIPVLLVIAAVRLFKRSDGEIGWLMIGGYAGLIFSTSGLLVLVIGPVRFRGAMLSAGGWMGSFSVEFLRSYFNTTGTVILLFLLFIIALMITADLSVVVLARMAADKVRAVRSRLENYILEKMENGEEDLPEDQPPSPPPVVDVKGAAPEKEKKPVPLILESTASPLDARTKRRKSEQAAFDFVREKSTFQLPPLTLLDDLKRGDATIKKESLIANARVLEQKLADFGVEGRVVEVKPGPLITMYELEPAPGVKLNRITNLSDDPGHALRAPSLRIAPHLRKAVVGIEIPNQGGSRSICGRARSSGLSRIPIQAPHRRGRDIVGTPVITDLARMPHLLIAGTTGSGKSVSLNAMICSILFRFAPEDVKLLMIDPKRLELSGYEGIPHLLHPVVVNPKDASQVLKWAVVEMERRYRVIGESGVKSIERYNRLVEKELFFKEHPSHLLGQEGTDEEDEAPDTLFPVEVSHVGEGGSARIPFEKLPYIVIVIDELADLMMVAQRNVEESLTRLAQMARAAGIHLILATQRPSVDVITGIIKANFPTRISFQVSSKVDSRTILDQLGAEQLLGSGDMLFLPPGTSRLSRIHGAYVAEKEIERVVAFLKKQAEPRYDESILKYQPETANGEKKEEEFDEKYDEAVELVTDLGQASISLVQRYMKIGYNRAARIIEKMEAEGIVGPSDGVKPRKVLAKKLPQ